jgi:hypothetical protein
MGQGALSKPVVQWWLSRTLYRAPVGHQGPSGPDWLAIAFGFWSGRALATGTAWAGLCLTHHHQQWWLSLRLSLSSSRGLVTTTAWLLFWYITKKK